jgi:translocation and assembly module TamB
VSGAVQIREPRVDRLAFDSASGRVVVRGHEARIDEARIRSRASIYTLSGGIGWGRRPTVALDVQADRASAAWLGDALGVTVPLAGVVDGRVRVEGLLARPAIHGSLSLREGRVFGQQIDAASAGVRWDGRRLALEGAAVRRRQSEVRFAGAFDRLTGLALDMSARGLDLQDVALPAIGATRLEGRIDLTGRLTGTLAAPVLAIGGSSSDLAINGLRFDAASGAIRWSGHTLQLEPLALRLAQQRYEIGGEVSLGSVPRVALSASVTDGRLTTLLGLAGARLRIPLDGSISGEATLEGALANPAARLNLKLAAGRLGDHAVDGHADLTLRDGNLTIETFELRPEQGRIAASGRYDLRGESQIEVSGSDIALDVLRPILRLRRPLLGRLNFTMQLGGTLAAPELGFDAEVSRGGIEGATFDSLVASAFYRDGVLQLQQGLLVQSGHKLRASGSIPFNPRLLRFDEQAPLDLRLTLADVNLGLLRLLTDRVEQATGDVDGELRINGTVSAPRATGGLSVSEGAVRVRGLRTALQAVHLDLGFSDSAIRVTGSARAGDGTLNLNGTAHLALGAAPAIALVVPADAPLVLTGSGVQLQAPPALDARFDGALRLWGTLGDPRRPPTLGGRVTLSDGSVAVGGAGTGPGQGPPLVFEGLEVGVGRNLVAVAGGMRFVLKPESVVVLGGTLQAPTLDGTIEAQRGAVAVLGNSFDLEEGTATFRPALGIRPQVSARAVTQVGSTRIAAVVQGTAPDALTLEFRSTPELSQQEIATLLGRHAGISQLLSGDLQGALRAELSRRLFAPVTLAIGRAVGLTELAIEYDFERPLSLRAGKALFRDLYLTATTTFAERTRLFWALEYRFARAWQFVLRVDADGRRDAIFWYTRRF